MVALEEALRETIEQEEFRSRNGRALAEDRTQGARAHVESSDSSVTLNRVL